MKNEKELREVEIIRDIETGAIEIVDKEHWEKYMMIKKLISLGATVYVL